MRMGGEIGGYTCNQWHNLPPHLVLSVAWQGEWLMVTVFDVYWHCANPRDQYLGHVIAGLNALKGSHKILPPQFKDKNVPENPLVHKAMNLIYGPILRQWAGTQQDPTGILLHF